MNRFTISSLILLVASLTMSPRVFAQTPGDLIPQDPVKRAQTGFKFLSVITDARAASMAGALTAVENMGAAAMFYNPSSMSRMEDNVDVTFGQVQWIAGINYNAGAAAFRTSYGIFGVNLVAVDYGDIQGTIRDPSVADGYIDTGLYSPTALAIGVGYAYAISDKFSVGAGARFVEQDLTDALITRAVPATDEDPAQDEVRNNFKENTMAFDFGLQYRTGFKSLNFAMSVRNFSQEVRFEQDDFELPLVFNIGLSMDVLDFTDMNKEVHSLMVSFDTNKPRDFSSQARVGAEYTFMDLLHLRGGYIAPTDEEGYTLGAGISKSLESLGFAVDYAYTDFGLLDTVNRFSVRLSF